MVSKEYIYILSRDFQLIRQYIDYSVLTGKYEIVGIHTEEYLAIENIRLNEATVLIVDSITMGPQILRIVDDFILHSDVEKKSIIYLLNKRELSVEKRLKDFYKYFIMLKSYDILDLLYTLDTIYNSRKNKDWEIEDYICARLQSLDIATHLLGFTYLTKACLLRCKMKEASISQVFAHIAREMHTTSSRVDRCIRNAIQYAYEKDKEKLTSFCQYKRKPSNSRFIACVLLEIGHQF